MIRGIHPLAIQTIFDDPNSSFLYLLDLCQKSNADIDRVINLLQAGETAIRLIRHRPAGLTGSPSRPPKV